MHGSLLVKVSKHTCLRAIGVPIQYVYPNTRSRVPVKFIVEVVHHDSDSVWRASSDDVVGMSVVVMQHDGGGPAVMVEAGTLSLSMER